ncbi:unnamed protein product [Phaedon cochleariae]|uniref:Helicase ARIP4 n=1 Tax=Phaedon cochleariae TaxID=80249 RepID=A0A9P0DMC5_PHACE|nr:unnamed protein product [Phaedon cochleariae]
MDPVLQRLGDVTIQRLEKPKDSKMGPQNVVPLEKPKENPEENFSEVEEEEEEESEDEFHIPGLKRPFPSSEVSMKKFKFNNSDDITLEKKVDEMLGDHFSETEMSDYDTESEMEESDEEPSEVNNRVQLNEVNEKPVPDKETPQLPSNSEDEASSSTSFFDKLVEQVEAPAPSVTSSSAPSDPPAEAPHEEDYDIDIKEKLKEMGEISFETVKKGEKPKKTEPTPENEVVVTPAKKFGSDGEEIPGLPKGIALRRNIREVMDETKLDESTLAAQRLEAERLRRVQEQQRLLRELQRQAAQERMQHKVISMLQGNQFSKPGPSSQTRIGNTVLVKLPNGQTKPMTRIPKRPFELVRIPKNAAGPPSSMGAPPRNNRSLLAAKKAIGAELTPSVSIAPVSKKMMYPPTAHRRHSDSDSEDDRKIGFPPPQGPRPRGKQPVQTIDISSDDDCIVVSEPDGDDADDDGDDPTNSGLHTNDQFNRPDDLGRVLVNVGHPEGEPDVFVAPQIARIIKPHQIGGVRFLYDNLVESIDRFESSPGFGCILAHSMGLGKTLQIVTFSDIFLRHTPARTVLCIMPINTLQNWMAEFNMWVPTEENAADCPLNAHGEVRPRNFGLHVLNDSHKTLVARAKVIHEWRTKGGVLMIGYEQFRLLSLRKFPKSRKKGCTESVAAEDDKNRVLFDEVQAALVTPGPDLVICDEGHRIKNSHASISQALKQMSTKRRVVLTGYPLQNNLMEYWCMVDFVRPNYLGSKTEFCNMFERPIMNGQCIDSTEADIKLMRYRAHVLHSLLLGFVQRRSHTVLHSALPQKEEYVLMVRMTPFQRTLYETFMNEVVRIQAVPNPLKAFAVCCKIWNHPDVLYNFLKKRAGGEAVDIDLEEVGGAPVAKPTNEKPPPRPRGKKPAKGQKGKPAASVTPYNSSTDPQNSTVNTPSSSPSGSIVNSSPITSFSNAISQQGKDNIPSSFNQPQTTNLQDVSKSFPENIPQPYYDQEFDQNAQFPSSFPNTTNNYQSFPNTPSTNYSDSSFNLSENNHSQPTTKSTLLNLDQQTMNNSSQQSGNSFANLSSEISLTPVAKRKEQNNPNTLNTSLPSISNSNISLTPLKNTNSTLTSLKSTSVSLTPLSSPSMAASTSNSLSQLNHMTTSLTLKSTSISRIDTNGTNLTSLDDPNSALTPLVPTSNSSLTPLQNCSELLDIGNQTPFSQNQHGQNFNQNQFQEYPQNYWGQQKENSTYNQQNDYFGPPNNQFNPNLANSESNQSWIKKEDSNSKQFVSPKSDNGSESKPKINIISDIKLPSVFGSPSKIKILSDIKIEPKVKEEGIDMFEMSPIKNEFLNELKGEIKAEFLDEFDSEVKNEFNSDVKSEVKSEVKTEVKLEEMRPPPPPAQQDNPFAKMNPLALRESKEDSGIPYDWAIELLKDYKPGYIENGAKMEILFCIIRESIALGDRLLVFSQSLITLDLIEQFLQSSQVPGETFNWAKNASYYRLDGSTSALEREKLINEFNSNPNIHLFLVSTRAGSLGINLVGANRVVVLDASWNPCHDTQAVCRVYRYGQRKPCFVYRLVVDNCLEKKIYDRQINKQGMSDRVVDECNPDAHLTMKDVSTLCWDDKCDDGEAKEWAHTRDNYIDVVLQKVLERHGRTLNKEPFQHESLLVDRKEKQLSSQEKRLAKKGYEREKQASRQPAYSLLGSSRGHRPVASVRPMQQNERPSRWIPAEHWQRQGMTAQEMTLPLDVVIPTNQPEKGNIVLKAGQKVLVLKSPKGVYMQLESGKIVAIKTAIKVKGKTDEGGGDPMGKQLAKQPPLPPGAMLKGHPSLSVVPQKRAVKPFAPGGGPAKFATQSVKQAVPNLVSRIKSIQKRLEAGKTHPKKVGVEIAKSLVKEGEIMAMGSGEEDHNADKQKPPTETADEIQRRISMLKKNISIQRVPSGAAKPPGMQQHPQAPTMPSRTVQRPPVEEKEESSPDSSTALEHLESTANSMMSDSADSTPFQDTLDSITSAYQATNEDNMESFEDDISETSDTPKNPEHSEASDQSDEVTYVSDQSPGSSQYQPQTPQSATGTDPNTYNYYNYNTPPAPYHAPPPQGYAYPPQHPPPYDMMGYPPQPAQPQYNYGYQGYAPAQPHYGPPPPPQPGYDYNSAPPATPVYPGYHQYPQQYPPPPQPHYPPPPAAGPAPAYSEYQQYPSTVGQAPPPAPFYPNT